MPLSVESREVMLSIFKAARNARHTLKWKRFNQAMVELGFVITLHGVVLTYAVPLQWGGGALVLHMDHNFLVYPSRQDYLKTRLSRAFGWDKATFAGGEEL